MRKRILKFFCEFVNFFILNPSKFRKNMQQRWFLNFYRYVQGQYPRVKEHVSNCFRSLADVGIRRNFRLDARNFCRIWNIWNFSLQVIPTEIPCRIAMRWCRFLMPIQAWNGWRWRGWSCRRIWSAFASNVWICDFFLFPSRAVSLQNRRNWWNPICSRCYKIVLWIRTGSWKFLCRIWTISWWAKRDLKNCSTIGKDDVKFGNNPSPKQLNIDQFVE